MITTTQEERRTSGAIVLLADVEAMLELSADTLRAYVRAGKLPRPLKLGNRVYWDAAELGAALVRAPRAEKWLGPEAGDALQDSQDSQDSHEEAEAA